jgi:hypothetical protein
MTTENTQIIIITIIIGFVSSFIYYTYFYKKEGFQQFEEIDSSGYYPISYPDMYPYRKKTNDLINYADTIAKDLQLPFEPDVSKDLIRPWNATRFSETTLPEQQFAYIQN